MGSANTPCILYLRPWTVKSALPFVRDVHRHLPAVQGAMWAVSARVRGVGVVGCALVGHAARVWSDEEGVLCVIRVAVREDPNDPERGGYKNACSMLYGACSKMARSSGAEDLVTYTLPDEDGTSLRAAGWIDGGLTDGGEHSRPSRRRKPAVDARPKRRWFAPWGKRAKEIRHAA